ncbi:MAG: single-stranded-DNA-specific exonuclease RecJ [Spirochaetales bacterium]
MRWQKQEIDPVAVRAAAERYNIDLLPAAILARRGITDSESVQYILEEDPRYLHNPFLFEEMEDAVDRIQQARTEGERVLVFGDRDADGITATAVLVRTLREMDLEVEWAVPMGDEPYGIGFDTVDRFRDTDGTLIITVDCGITAAPVVNHAAERGIDTIVVDHHNVPEEVPPAVAIINPKTPDSGYPFEGLCGSALAAKLRWALIFGDTELYKQPVVLLNAYPGNDTVVIEAVKLVNLVETDRLTETLVPGMVSIESTRLFTFLQGQAIIVYEERTQQKLLSKVFGNGVEINVLDIAPQVHKLYPKLQGKSLLRMREQSRMAVYASEKPSELDVFINLYRIFVIGQHPRLGVGYSEKLDLPAVGTIADLMPMLDENRILVKQGLRALATTANPGMRELLSRLGLAGRSLRARDVSWTLSPVLNASGRMGKPDKAVELLISDDRDVCMKRADEIIELNRDRRRIGEEAWERVLPKARESYDKSDGRFIMVRDDTVHRGITGIVAGRLARMFNTPAAVVAEVEERAVGSVRAMRGFTVTDFLRELDDILEDWGGHDAAGGFHLELERFDELEQRVDAMIPNIVLDEAEEPLLSVDAELPRSHMKPDVKQVVDTFAPFGQEHPPLVFMSRGLRLSEADFIGKGTPKHLKLLIDAGVHKWPAVYWNAAERLGVDFSTGDTVDVVFEIGTNHYQGVETLQMVVLDMRRGGT